ncbi:hypothetical protein RJT34_01397 [Clitoria ternatea]|uniref:Uncharacterized protein n=1 Tax=Clitoria ternatea TaxID=43366 RepID=A0AAN9KI40_CLITE
MLYIFDFSRCASHKLPFFLYCLLQGNLVPLLRPVGKRMPYEFWFSLYPDGAFYLIIISSVTFKFRSQIWGISCREKEIEQVAVLKC